MTRREKLIERLGVHIESKDQIAPLAARILSTLILTGKQGITFDGLVCELNASKSSISTHLTTLQASENISYYTKPGDRKKYFILNPDVMIHSMEEMIRSWNNERALHMEIMDYKQEINETLSKDAKEKFDLDFHTEYLEYLDQASASMKKLQTTITQKHTND